jgi:glycosyltransferase involved in cell wall biosynthesis
VRRWLRPLWGPAALARLVPGVVRSWAHDVTLFQRELFSTFVTLEPLARRPSILVVDDAMHLLRGGRAMEGLARRSVAVICGNAWLAEIYARWNRTIHVIPTAVDTDRFVPGPGRPDEGRLVIGWSGSAGGFGYLRAIEPALAEVLRRFPAAVLRVVAESPPHLPGLPPGRLEYVRWSPEVEVAVLQDLAVGLMPLEDSPWARGKCAFKMLTYMACGVPVVVSPVGMNVEVLGRAELGLGATTQAEWVDAIGGLLADAAARRAMGLAGRRVAEGEYSRRAVVPRLEAVLRSARA